jgi:hypothetical protein
MKLIIKEKPAPCFVGLWASTLTCCFSDGYIVRYIQGLKSDNTLAIPWSDGFRYTLDKDKITSNYTHNKSDVEGYEEHVIIGLQASLILSLNHGIKNKIIHLPLDDDTFQFGLKKVLEDRISNLYLPWEDRKPIAFWRGAGPHPLRQKIVEELFHCKHSDVLYGRIPGNTQEQWSQKWWDKTYEGKWQPIEMSEFVKHKYILIIDNFIITGSYQWVFGSGSVPILVNHPMTDFWFKEYLIPWVNYVPVTHPDFGVLNIKNVIEFLIEHDDIAKRIAENARQLSYKIFSPEFQREYLKNRLNATD